MFYHFFSNGVGLLYSPILKAPITSILDAIYFSFITATSTGFGDIVPQGVFSIVAVIEVTFGLLLLALVTSKLVSIKQNLILTEVYEISFAEKINRLRSNLLLFRQQISRLSAHVDSGEYRKREITDMYIYFDSFAQALEEILILTNPKKKHNFTKSLDIVNLELLLNSVLRSCKRIDELLSLLIDIDWKRDITSQTLTRCLFVIRGLLAQIDRTYIAKQEVSDLCSDIELYCKRVEKFIS